MGKPMSKFNETVLLSDYEGNLEDKCYTEPNCFVREQNLYRENLLHLIMDLISKELTRLTAWQREVILRFFFSGESLHAIAKTSGVSCQAVSDSKNGAVLKLRRRLQENPYFIKLYSEYLEDDPKISVLLKFFDEKA